MSNGYAVNGSFIEEYACSMRTASRQGSYRHCSVLCGRSMAVVNLGCPMDGAGQFTSTFVTGAGMSCLTRKLSSNAVMWARCSFVALKPCPPSIFS